MKKDTLLDQFCEFYYRNYPEDMEMQIEYFALFGGLDIDIDTSVPIPQLLKHHILDNIEYYERKIDALLLHNKHYHKLLRVLAQGDRRIFRAFNKAGFNNGNGGAALNYLELRGIITIEYSRELHPRHRYDKQKLKRSEARHRISHKVLFRYPFLRFWFYAIYPYLEQIKAKQTEPFFENFYKIQNSYTSLVYEELSLLVLHHHVASQEILSSGSYWDAKVEIDILVATKEHNVYIAECKWSNRKINKKEYHKLVQKCATLGIEPTQILFFSKRGFSKEMLQSASKDLALFSAEDFEVLLDSTRSTKRFVRLL